VDETQVIVRIYLSSLIAVQEQTPASNRDKEFEVQGKNEILYVDGEGKKDFKFGLSLWK
jgi:hypothetical protein